MKKKYILAIDQGTTGTRAIVYDRFLRECGSAYRELRQYYPRPGWVEHDPHEIWTAVCRVIEDALKSSGISRDRIECIGITNQRETSLIWDRRTSRPAGRAIVWQDRRTSDVTASLRQKPLAGTIRSRTGLVADPYFSATKIAWLLDSRPGLRKKARSGGFCFGTVDSWLIWKLSGGKVHVTDRSNASRTLLYNIHTHVWDRELGSALRVPDGVLPEVRDSGGFFAESAASVKSLASGTPVLAVMGDQQSALFGQGCFRSGQVKNTYGTGCFIVMNLGRRKVRPPKGLLVTVACDSRGKPVYALEGAVFSAGSAVQWLRDELGIIANAAESASLAGKTNAGANGVLCIPAFNGLGSPWWNPEIRGTLTGITRGTGRNEIVRAVLESIAHQTADVVEAMQSISGRRFRELRVDGGASANRLLMQIQADFLGIPVRVAARTEATALGAAMLAGVQAGIIPAGSPPPGGRGEAFCRPRMKAAERRKWRDRWHDAVRFLLRNTAFQTV